MSVKLLTEQNLEFLSLKVAVQAGLSLHMSKYHIVGNHMSWLNYRWGSGAAVYIFRSQQRISQRAVHTSHEKQLDPFLREGVRTSIFKVTFSHL